jgi:predicted site-specific integrase-resolvase
MMPAIPRTVAYLRVSTREQDLEKRVAYLGAADIVSGPLPGFVASFGV